MFVCPSSSLNMESAYSYSTFLANGTEAAITSVHSSSDVLMGVDGVNSWMQSNTLAEGNRFSSRHNDGLNVVFLDGHVKWQRLNALTYGQINWQATSASTPPASQHMPYP